ncbi:MAG: hypothetical protein Q7T82_10680 [Armatimonadota bacterium]|nr:hypothetical protein [Armatimonadota bacterium]
MANRRLSLCLVVLVMLMAALAGCGKPGRVRNAVRKPAVTPPRAGRGLQSPRLRVVTHGVRELSWQSGGRYIMRARAKTFVADEETGKARLKGAKAILYKNGREAASLSADTIDADAKAGTLRATGGIVVQSLLGNVRARAESLVWKNRENRLLGEGGISVASDAGALSADRLEGDTTLKEVKLWSDKGGKASLAATALKLSL